MALGIFAGHQIYKSGGRKIEKLNVLDKVLTKDNVGHQQYLPKHLQRIQHNNPNSLSRRPNQLTVNDTPLNTSSNTEYSLSKRERECSNLNPQYAECTSFYQLQD